MEKGYDFRRTVISAVGLAALFLIVMLVNVLLSFVPARIDATEEKLYSLSEGTRNILARLDEPVTIQFFFSRESADLVGQMKLYARRVEDFLSEYERAAGGKIVIERVDPKPDSDAEDWALSYGLKSLPTGGGEPFYCGLAFLCQDREEVIEFLDPGREDLLEYDVTRSIQRVSAGARGVVGVISPLPVLGADPGQPGAGFQQADSRPWFFVEELRKTYEVREVPLSADRIDPDVDLVLLVHPKDLEPGMEYALDQYVLGGGRMAVFVDPFCVSDTGRPMMSGAVPSSSLPRLFGAWGIDVESGRMVVDFEHATTVRGATGQTENNPLILSIGKDGLDAGNVVTSRLEQMLLPVAGAIARKPGASVDFEPLVSTGREAALVETARLREDPAGLRKGFAPGGPYPVAVRIGGHFESAFPDGPPADESGGEEASPSGGASAHLDKGLKSAAVIVAADVDFLADRFSVQRGSVFGFNVAQTFNDNLNFLANACEILIGGDDLIGIRSRGTFERPFDKVLIRK
ncbi:GldG family protein [Desulfatiglans anilini]|uniref:GldG family protein n=1 Tax=Desulfatiglans anilini TaxID=90728 RepID=UPI00040EDA7E|nr:GldG family protein [Desulfatiglans anilini]